MQPNPKEKQVLWINSLLVFSSFIFLLLRLIPINHKNADFITLSWIALPAVPVFYATAIAAPFMNISYLRNRAYPKKRATAFLAFVGLIISFSLLIFFIYQFRTIRLMA